MTELAGIDVYAAGDVHAGDVDLDEVRRDGPDGVLVRALDRESRGDLEEALIERAVAEPDPGEHVVRLPQPLPTVTAGIVRIHHRGRFYEVEVGADGIARFEAVGPGRQWAYRLKTTRMGRWGAEDAGPNEGKGYDTIPARVIGLRALKWAHGLI